MHLKISSAKWRPFCPGRCELNSGLHIHGTVTCRLGTLESLYNDRGNLNINCREIHDFVGTIFRYHICFTPHATPHCVHDHPVMWSFLIITPPPPPPPPHTHTHTHTTPQKTDGINMCWYFKTCFASSVENLSFCAWWFIWFDAIFESVPLTR